MFTRSVIVAALAALLLSTLSATPPALAVGENGRCLTEAATGRAIFLLADTAWNLGALRREEAAAYLSNRSRLGFNAVMFALNFAPQAEERNAYGEAAYIGPGKSRLNPAYFASADAVVADASDRGLYVIVFALWAGVKAGTMNHYPPEGLGELGRALGRHFAGVSNVILCAGGEASPPYVDPARVNAMGAGLKAGCGGRNLVTVHPVAAASASRWYSDAAWIDFYLIQAKSSHRPESAAFDAAALVLSDWSRTPARPTMMGEYRYESGTSEDPLLQRRGLYQCALAGACGFAYGHDALWQMTPHTGKPWMLKDWPPGVARWTEALDTPAARQLHHLRALFATVPWWRRFPCQSLVLRGQGEAVAARVQACRDGTPGRNDATFVLAYASAPTAVTLDTSPLGDRPLSGWRFDPATGSFALLFTSQANAGHLDFAAAAAQRDAVYLISTVRQNHPSP